MDNRKVLIIGGGRQGPTFRNALYMKSLLQLGFDVEYYPLGDFQPRKEKPNLCLFHEYSDLEARIMASNPDGLHWMLPEKEPSPDKLKGPKGPRTKWGKLK